MTRTLTNPRGSSHPADPVPYSVMGACHGSLGRAGTCRHGAAGALAACRCPCFPKLVPPYLSSALASRYLFPGTRKFRETQVPGKSSTAGRCPSESLPARSSPRLLSRSRENSGLAFAADVRGRDTPMRAVHVRLPRSPPRAGPAAASRAASPPKEPRRGRLALRSSALGGGAKRRVPAARRRFWGCPASVCVWVSGTGAPRGSVCEIRVVWIRHGLWETWRRASPELWLSPCLWLKKNSAT
jgi:hypothetical protein